MAIQNDVFSASSYVAMVTGSFCMWSAGVVALCYFAFPELRSAWRLYVLFLSFADFLQGLYYTMDGAGTWHDEPDKHPSKACLGFAYVGIWSASASFLWSACVSAYVSFFLTRHMRLAARQQRAPPAVTALFCLVAFGYPTAIVALLIVFSVPINHNQVHADAYGCFIDASEWSWRFASIYAPLWASMVVVAACSVLSLWQVITSDYI